MGRNRKKGGGGGGGGTGAVTPAEGDLGGGNFGGGAPTLTPPEPPEEVPVAATAPRPTGDDLTRTIFGDDIFEPGTPRTLEPGRIREAWNRTPASALETALVNGPIDRAITSMYGLPTAREYFDIPTPERNPLTKRQVNRLAEVLADSPIVEAGGYAAVLEDVGVAGLPQATSRRLRVGSDTQAMVTRISELSRTLPGIENLTPDNRARVVALMDTLGGISLTRERAWETMILTQGQSTPKGAVLGRTVKRMNDEARRISNEINRLMGVTAAPQANGLPRRNTPAAEAYSRLYAKPGSSYNYRALNHKAPLYANRGLESINND